jgi:virulence factor Mce-like protein
MAGVDGLLAGGQRRYRIVVGLATMLFLSTLVVYSVKTRVGGDPADYYQVEATFATAGQGLIAGSDVKVHGADVGRVKSVRLVQGRAVVRMDIKNGRSCKLFVVWCSIKSDEARRHRIPVDARATIRPKTLFGEKFVDVDPGEHEATGPFMRDESRFAADATTGGFELERVLVDLYPLLKAVKPSELATVLDELAKAGDGKGPQINRTISLYATLLHDQAANDAELDEFLRQLATVSEELVDLAPVALQLAGDLNATLPDLNQRSAQLGALLDETTRLSSDLDALLSRNEPTFEKMITQGGKTVQQLFDDRESISPLVKGLRQFFQVLGSVGHIDYGDGTKLAAVKFVANSDCPRARIDCGDRLTLDGKVVPAATAASTGRTKPAAGAPGVLTGAPDGGPILPVPSTGTQAILDLVLPTLGVQPSRAPSTGSGSSPRCASSSPGSSRSRSATSTTATRSGATPTRSRRPSTTSPV